MKKTFKKALMLMAVITVMMICAIMLPVSAAEICPDGKHTALEEKVTPPTCTEDGYTEVYCSACGTVVSTSYDKQSRTGHNFVVTGYEEDGGAYKRVVTCTNDVCARGSVNPIVLKSAPVYHLVKFENAYESPELGEVANHKGYFLEYYYVASDKDTWVVDTAKSADASFRPEFYAPAKEENTSVTMGEDIEIVINPDYEYFDNSGTIELYVLSGQTAVYNGNIPTRYKDTKIGRYTFDTWVSEGGTAMAEYPITANTTLKAKFTADENVVLKYTFMNGLTVLTTSQVEVPYGHTFSYDAATPLRDRTVQSTYIFSGWKVDNVRKVAVPEGVAPIDTPITLYHEAVIYADFDEIPNKYTVAFENYAGKEFEKTNNPLVDIICGQNAFESVTFTDADLARPSSPKYNYAYSGKWQITKVNGKEVANSGMIIDLQKFLPPQVVYVKTAPGETTAITSENYETITVAPHYQSGLIQYTIKVKIFANYFEESDYVDPLTPRPDILDDFNVIVYDGNGNYITNTTTDTNGEATVKVNYSDIITIRVATKSGKYTGEHTINMAGAYQTFLPSGTVGIAPTISQEWLDGNTHSCSCLCHTFLSGILIRIYNVLYSLFKIEYVCCDDLFATHGEVLAYARPM